MKYSKLFGKTLRGQQSGSDLISHQLLIRGGFIAESVAGRYYFLPLGWRVHEKIKKIIAEKMNSAGAQEMIAPTLHPLELWAETNRTSTAGFELMQVEDRRGAKFALGGTAEEMFVDLARKMNLSYRDLPFNIYQFSAKFRDELRARGGLLRVREFVMKDAYSFHRDEEDFKKEYEKMAKVYAEIFTACGLDSKKVLADNGYIGGEYCHEFQVESPIGEGRFFVSEDGKYTAHEDVARFKPDEKNLADPEIPLQKIDAPRGNTMEDGVKFHKLPLWQQMKDVMFADENGELILAVIRGDLDVNECKVKKAAGVHTLRPATEDEIRAIGSEPGFICPVGLEKKCKIIGDFSLRTVKNFYGGANEKNRDHIGINPNRDFKCDLEADIAMAFDGAQTEKNGKLIEKTGIEVGNIFQLGYHYSEKMQGAEFIDDDGKSKPFYMGCYGIGLGRTLATIVEIHHDDRGILWPKSVAPFQIFLAPIGKSEEVFEKSEEIHDMLESAGIETLLDDRRGKKFGPGQKFADHELLGIPARITISEKTLAENSVEFVERRNLEKTQKIKLSEIENFVKNWI